MKLFTTAQLTMTLAIVAGVTQAMPLTSEASGTSSMALREIFDREPQLFYGRQSGQDLEQRGIFGSIVGKLAGSAIEKVGGSKGAAFGKVVKGLFSIF